MSSNKPVNVKLKNVRININLQYRKMKSYHNVPKYPATWYISDKYKVISIQMLPYDKFFFHFDPHVCMQ